MEIKYYGSANKLDFWTVILNSVLDDYNNSTNETHEISEIVEGLTYQKLIKNNMSDFTITRLDKINFTYCYEIKSSKNLNRVSIVIANHNDGIEVTYTNTLESIGLIQTLNDNIVSMLFNKSKRRSVIEMLSAINDYCMEEEKNA